MLETIILKLLNYLGDSCGFDYVDLRYAVELNDDEIERCKELVEEAKNDI